MTTGTSRRLPRVPYDSRHGCRQQTPDILRPIFHMAYERVLDFVPSRLNHKAEQTSRHTAVLAESHNTIGDSAKRQCNCCPQQAVQMPCVLDFTGRTTTTLLHTSTAAASVVLFLFAHPIYNLRTFSSFSLPNIRRKPRCMQHYAGSFPPPHDGTFILTRLQRFLQAWTRIESRLPTMQLIGALISS